MTAGIESNGIVQAAELTELEAVIQRGMQTFVEVGAALLRIREERLYREAGYSDFDTYCRERWNWSRRHADRQIDAAEVAELLRPAGLISDMNQPAVPERQVRELAPLKDAPEALRAAWQAARDGAQGQPTAEDVRAATTAAKTWAEQLAENSTPDPATVERWTAEVAKHRVKRKNKQSTPAPATVRSAELPAAVSAPLEAVKARRQPAVSVPEQPAAVDEIDTWLAEQPVVATTAAAADEIDTWLAQQPAEVVEPDITGIPSPATFERAQQQLQGWLDEYARYADDQAFHQAQEYVTEALAALQDLGS